MLVKQIPGDEHSRTVIALYITQKEIEIIQSGLLRELREVTLDSRDRQAAMERANIITGISTELDWASEIVGMDS